MGVLSVYQSLRERFLSLLILLGLLAGIPSGYSEETLPFDPVRICRYSVDNIPRSISIRQGAGVWLGYDLEKALVFKAWQAPEGKPGVVVNSFKAQSAGAVLFDGKAKGAWQLQRDGKNIPLTARYLGCVQNSGSFELSWELNYPDGSIKLSERIATDPGDGAPRAVRELRAESLEQGASLMLPAAYGDTWTLTGADRKPAKSITGTAWHQLSLR